MKHTDFAIGTEFFTATGPWRCTAVGRRVIVAIAVTPGREEGRWGPPYVVQEVVFAENDPEGCSPVPLPNLEIPTAAYDADLCRWLTAQLTS